MITIQPEIEILSTESYEDMLRRIEKIGRVCYKSEERIGEGTAEKFIAGIIKRGHESVIEHGSITVKVTRSVLLSRLRRSDAGSRRKIRKRIFMSMPFRHLANTGFIRNGWASICFP